jgi:polyketide cyclase/dehydrase/lipid transport protein
MLDDAVRLEARAWVEVAPADLYAVAADLRNLPAWWIEHLSAEITTPAARLRDSVYEVRYRMWGAYVITGTCTVVAARPGRSLTYTWEGGGFRLAVGQEFEADEGGCDMRLEVDLHVGRVLEPFSWIVLRLMRRRLSDELGRALETLGELAAARSVMRRAAPRRPLLNGPALSQA